MFGFIKSNLSKLKDSLLKTKDKLGSAIGSLFNNRGIDQALLDDLETILLQADLGFDTTSFVLEELKKIAKKHGLNQASELLPHLKALLLSMLEPCCQDFEIKSPTPDMPFVLLMVGVNGSGKTTTLGKLAKQIQAQGKSVLLAAGDTFRAAAIEQLKTWAERNEVPIIAQEAGSDSASVIFDALQSAQAKKIDCLLADTAGRLHTQSHLMEELKKIARVLKKLDPKAPHEILLVLDATLGQNAIKQVEIFNQALSLTGLAITKLDGSAKAGVIFNIAKQFKLPIRFIGTGEGIDDLKLFSAPDFVEALFDTPT
ncbi:MAG: signal recognition particle-docking protein FtsY [Gammaproteobacteria bacterium]